MFALLSCLNERVLGMYDAQLMPWTTDDDHVTVLSM